MANVVNKEILNSLGDYILIVDRDYNIVFANRAMLQLCERKEKDVIGQKCHKFSHHCHLPCYKEGKAVICPHREVFKTGKTISVTHTHKLPNGAEKIFDITASPIRDENGDVIQMLEVLRDVTERKKTEEVLDFEHRQLLSIFDSIDEVVYVSDPNTYDVLYANQAIRKALGNVVGKKCYLVFQGMESPCSFCTNDRIFGKNVGRTYIGDFQNRINKKWYHCIDKAIRWPNGRMVRCEVAIDITERKMAEEVRKKHEVFISSVLDGIQDGVVVIDRDFKIVLANKGYLEQTKSTLDEVTGKHCYEVSHHMDKPCYLAGEKCSVKNAFETGLSYKIIHTHFNKDNNPIYVETISYPLKDISGNITSVVEMITDISEKMKLENELKKRIKELEEFYDIAIGRELRMVEFKEEIESLKEELKKRR